jgi:hypothetical protein
MMPDIDEAEASVPFYDHVLLNHHLKQFPDIEPVQRFMEIVLNGLSLNSYMTLGEKREIIEWYRKYFDENLQTIRDALDASEFHEQLVEIEHRNAP